MTGNTLCTTLLAKHCLPGAYMLLTKHSNICLPAPVAKVSNNVDSNINQTCTTSVGGGYFV